MGVEGVCPRLRPMLTPTISPVLRSHSSSSTSSLVVLPCDRLSSELKRISLRPLQDESDGCIRPHKVSRIPSWRRICTPTANSNSTHAVPTLFGILAVRLSNAARAAGDAEKARCAFVMCRVLVTASSRRCRRQSAVRTHLECHSLVAHFHF